MLTSTAGAANTATITGTLAGTAINGRTQVTFTQVATASRSTISASPASIVANGTSTSTVTVQVKDAAGNTITTGGATVTLSTSAGTLSGVTDNGNGTYTATLTSATSPGSASITGSVNGNAISGSATVAFTQVFTSGCNRAGDVNGGLNVKGGLQINVEADCDAADKKHPTTYLHHGHIHVDGLGLKVDADTNGDDNSKKGDITGVTFTTNTDGSTTAVITGTWNGKSFTLTVTDAGKKAKGQDSFDFV